MNLILLFDRFKNKIRKSYREYIFKCRTGCKVNLVGDVILINTNIKIGRNVTLYPGVMLFGDGRIEIGDNVDIGNNTIIYASKFGGGVTIGGNTLIAAQCYIIDTDHGIKAGRLIRNQGNTVSPISIGKDCWIAANCTILKGAKISDGAVIGAKSLVKGTVESNSISVGIPARHLKFRE